MRQLSHAMLALLILSLPAAADEGMWTFHNFPAQTVKQQYGADITPAWLDKVRNSVVRLSNCTASFVSAEGLILTNHHCASACLAENSSRDESLLEKGFLAEGREKEIRCGTQVADVLVAMEDVTAKVSAATQGMDEKAANDKRKQTLTQLEQACEQTSLKNRKTGPLKCESVDLYQGGQYFLYKYKRYNDVRLVFAPEESIAAFGGDPDNFQFPRWCLDMSLLRAYDASGKPASTPTHLTIDASGPDPGELVLVPGHPGSTDRLLTVAQLRFLRDVSVPQYLLRSSELRGRYIQFAQESPQFERIADDPLKGLENGIKVRRKELDALHDEALFQRKLKEEAALRSHVTGSDPWAAIEKAVEIERGIDTSYGYLESGIGFNSRLFRYARSLVRGAAERPLANTERLREYRDSALPRIEQQLKAGTPVYPELEQLTLSFSLERMREWLGPDHPVVRRLLSEESPKSLAAKLVSGSKLADPAERMRLWQGGSAAIGASKDPMILLAQQVDAEARAVRKRYENEVEAPIQAASEKIAAARFAAYGASVYPDATFTLRLNFGTVQGWNEKGSPVPPFTTLSRAFERATGKEPFRIPDSWLKVKDRLNPETKFNLSTNNDIVGGNSGSPLIDANARIVGLIFDGNIHSISGSYWFDAQKNRSVAVHPAIIVEALDKVYGAKALLKELDVQP